jgi:DNA invertase Pin-like site-specific DNA recombinase
VVISAAYADAGASGVTLERPELQRPLADCRARKIGTIIRKDPDRLSRDTGQSLALLHIFRANGVRVEYSTREGKSGFKFLIRVLSAVAELQQATIRSKPKHRKPSVDFIEMTEATLRQFGCANVPDGIL